MYEHSALVHPSYPNPEAEHNHIGTRMAGDVVPLGQSKDQKLDALAGQILNQIAEKGVREGGSVDLSNVVAGPGNAAYGKGK